jgi:hypothetical protein
MRKIGWLLAIASTGLVPTAAAAQETATYAPAVLTEAAGIKHAPLLLARGGGNNPPDAVDDYIYLNCNSGGGFWMFTNDSDPDMDSLTITSASSSGGFSVTIGHAGLGILSIGAGPYAGVYYGSYDVSDGHGGTDTAVIRVVVYPGGPGGC